MRRLSWMFACVFFTVWLAGCAVGQKINYREAVFNPAPTDDIELAAATLDNRPNVTNETFVGLLRGGFGNPFPVGTASGKSLSDDMTEAVAASLEAKGYRVVRVGTTRLEVKMNVIQRLAATKAKRLILLDLKDWWSDTFMNTGLNFDVTLSVFDGGGSLLAKKEIRGKDNLGGNFFEPYYYKKAVPTAFAKKIESLFADPGIEKSLH